MSALLLSGVTCASAQGVVGTTSTNQHVVWFTFHTIITPSRYACFSGVMDQRVICGVMDQRVICGVMDQRVICGVMDQRGVYGVMITTEQGYRHRTVPYGYNSIWLYDHNYVNYYR